MEYLEQLFDNKIILTAALSWFIAQVIKIIIDLVKNKTINPALIISSGGMPSSHTSAVVALATCVGITEGFNSTLFAISFVFSMVVMYDAAGVRRAAGKQAEVLNMIVEKFEKQGIEVDSKLKELLGHSPVEVMAGGFLGIAVALLVYL